MRLRILELPMRHLGPASETPFILVFDQCTAEEGVDIAANAADARQATGAAGVVVFGHTIDLD